MQDVRNNMYNPVGQGEPSTSTGRSTEAVLMRRAKDFAGQKVIEAEKFRASIAPPMPQGNEQFVINNCSPNHRVNTVNVSDQLVTQFQQVNVDSGVNAVSYMDQDDLFFHVTCHIEPTLHLKIEKGEFIELEKLLVKDRVANRNDEQRMEMVNRDGSTFFVPASNKELKITGIRKWEQAFRVYAAIYSKANPHRASEIWQYVDIIHMAAAAYTWENVSFYDTTFRRLMAEYPQRSWAKTYTQMWHIAMRDPIQSRKFIPGGNFRSKERRDNYCWKFNKNQKHDITNCRYEHKCKYCDGTSHGFANCNKRKRNSNGGGHSHSGSNDEVVGHK